MKIALAAPARAQPAASTPEAARAPAAKPSPPAAARHVDAMDPVPPAAAAAPAEVARRFYDAFVNRRFDEMEALYSPDVKFKDMVFEYGDRSGTMKMWRKILADPSTQIRFEVDGVKGDVAHGRWVADYKVFGRKVHNELTFQMTVRDGKIVEHRDHSDWATWQRQAFPLGRIGELAPVKSLLIHLIRTGIDRF
ncbi:MAG: nuclear transport factor 2 family protein [Myxococcales bacterium]